MTVLQVTSTRLSIMQVACQVCMLPLPLPVVKVKTKMNGKAEAPAGPSGPVLPGGP
jgi:hypothetical protein